MQQDVIKALSAYGKNSVDAAKSLVEINGEFLNKMLDSQVSLANLYVEGSEKQLEVAAGATDPKEFFGKQTALVEEYSAKLADFAQSNAKLAEETSEKLKDWVQEGAKLAEENMKEVAAKATAA